MPVKSKDQYKLMKAVEKGAAKVPGLSRKEAAEMTEDMTPRDYTRLPKDKNTRFDKLRKKYKS